MSTIRTAAILKEKFETEFLLPALEAAVENGNLEPELKELAHRAISFIYKDVNPDVRPYGQIILSGIGLLLAINGMLTDGQLQAIPGVGPSTVDKIKEAGVKDRTKALEVVEERRREEARKRHEEAEKLRLESDQAAKAAKEVANAARRQIRDLERAEIEARQKAIAAAQKADSARRR